MPICPRCSTTIHAGAEDQCPACGYNIYQADETFGDGQVEFTRVVDAAGALTHQERIELMHTLEQLERRIRPVALCIYITDVGQAHELRTHAHWILNHARIHHPSFGKRELHKAIEDAELLERRPGEQRPQEIHQSWLATTWQTIRDHVIEALHPLPPPVKHEWMLILVMDVQLEMACFSWGYKLDPYIDPDRINTCIKSAKLQFRERAMVTGLKKVMRAAAQRISSTARRVNRKLRKAQKALTLAAALGLWLGGSTLAQDPTPPPAAAAAGEAAAPATPEEDEDMPFWRSDDYRHLMAGELLTGYTSLFPAKPTPEEIKAEEARKKELRRQQREQRRLQARQQIPATRPPEKPEESDTLVLGRYCDMYTKPADGCLLNDPQGLLTTVEREDTEHVLRTLNANAKFRIYATVFKGSQQIPGELAVNILVMATAQPCEYAVLVRYPMGNPAAIELGYQQISPGDDQHHEWLRKVRASAADGSAEGLMDALRCISGLITPMAGQFKPVTTTADGKLPLIPIELKPVEKKKKLSIQEKIQNLIEDPVVVNSVLYPLVSVLVLAGLWCFINWLRNSSKLVDTEADIRLSSPYGAGVSRYVRYLEGTEASKEKRLF